MRELRPGWLAVVNRPAAGKISLNSIVGFSNIPNQAHSHSMATGFDFTIMVAGAAGLGKTSFIRTMFGPTAIPSAAELEAALISRPGALLSPRGSIRSSKSSASGSRAAAAAAAAAEGNLPILTHSTTLEENGTRLRLTVLETSGFGIGVNNVHGWDGAVRCIKSRLDTVLSNERCQTRTLVLGDNPPFVQEPAVLFESEHECFTSQPHPAHLADLRVHACLYFINPSSRGLSPLDIYFLQGVHNLVSVIPIISKADTLTAKELGVLKRRIRDDLIANGISTFEIPVSPADDPDFVSSVETLNGAMPFSVLCDDAASGDSSFQGRTFPWGQASIEDESHSDYAKLRHMLIRFNLEDIRSHTVDVLYERYRTGFLNTVNRGRNAIDNLRDLMGSTSDPIIKLKESLNARLQEEVSSQHSEIVILTNRLKELTEVVEENNRKIESLKASIAQTHNQISERESDKQSGRNRLLRR
ncbi:hypothetical protein H696_01484 [Fonticula alba]|uniref:Septin-type G domain-containing protein n=1 Tax=Fonticula alba TaxID=691883 RepID=A0A058ZDP0_FONAL|nr:hypothetical protein H696_01484 [Fonticula alba]KCV72076.1 hypothetical protein H696_01484 [Fonticula alba]|eukprot:XP_009493654.1 hypothetical protein H696_01484 [Fonticula alba]